eukprot:1378006-Pyramimonas_sp.AAC.1
MPHRSTATRGALEIDIRGASLRRTSLFTVAASFASKGWRYLLDGVLDVEVGGEVRDGPVRERDVHCVLPRGVDVHGEGLGVHVGEGGLLRVAAHDGDVRVDKGAQLDVLAEGEGERDR